MPLYVIHNEDESTPALDANFAHVVRAKDAREARQLASKAAVDDDPTLWLDPRRSTIRQLRAAGPSVVIMSESNGF
jgi:hypothetical protein